VAALSESASSIVGHGLMTHCIAHKVGVSVKDIRCTETEPRASWAMDAGWHLLVSIAVSSQTLLTFGFRPKVPLYFQQHIRFRPNVLCHFRPPFGFSL